jgi:hypothetical protein
MGTHELDRVLRCKGVIRALPGDGFKLALASLPYPPQWLGEAVGGIYDLFLGKPPGRSGLRKREPSAGSGRHSRRNNRLLSRVLAGLSAS